MSYLTTDSLVRARLKMVEMYLKEEKTSYEIAEIFGILKKI